MERSETPKTPRHRLYVLLGIVAAVLACYLGVMFNLQVVHGEDYLRRSVSQIVRSTTVEAARGEITDRNGNLIVGNRQTYTLTFDASLLPDGVDENEAILRLVDLCIEGGVAYTDNVPLSQNAPFSYIETSSTAETQFGYYLNGYLETPGLYGRLEKALDNRREALETAAETGTAPKKSSPYLDALLEDPDLDVENMTPAQLMLAMRWDFDIAEDVSDADARKIAAVRCELSAKNAIAFTYILADDVNIDLITRIKDGDYYGADIGTAFTREYETTAAAHILGYVGPITRAEYEARQGQGYSLNATVGKTGVEAAFEEYLHGTSGTRLSNTNDEGKVTSELYTVEPQPGNTVELTLDLPFQEAVETLLNDKVEELNRQDGLTERGAAAVVIDIESRDILAIASAPTYDLSNFNKNYNEYAADPANPLWNRATMGLYAPGSTLKPLTAIAALQEGKTTRTEVLNDTGKWVYPGYSNSYTYCWKRSGHGRVNVTSAITNSCNYYFAEMGYRLGMDTLRKYLSAFGLGEQTGIETGDAAGTLPENPPGQDQAPWAAYGQSNQLYTPIQLANYIATLVSGGEFRSPHLLKTVRTYDNSAVVYSADEEEPTQVLDIDPQNLDAVLRGMLGYTQPGGQVHAYFQNCVVTAGAKTGTAQLGGDSENNGVFVCFAPYEDPEIAVAIVIEKGGSGAALAETAVNILNAYFTEEETVTPATGENALLG